MDNFYFLDIHDATEGRATDTTYAYVYDDLTGVTAAGKRALKRLPETGQLILKLIETENLGPAGGDKRTVTEFTGDADIVVTVLKKKLASERKQQDAGQPTPARSLPDTVDTI